MYNSIRTLCALACFAGLGEGVSAAPALQEPAESGTGTSFQDLPPLGYSTPRQMAQELEALARGSARMSLKEIGKAPSGQPLLMVTISGQSPAADGPEVLIVANLEGDRPATSEVAMGLIRHLNQGESPLLGVATVHILAVANPDGAMHALAGEGPWRGAGVDNDRDGHVDEDGPMDLDGDGRVLWLRVPSNSGAWHASATDERCSVEAKDVREVAGAFHLRREGMDGDGDRSFSEDGPGGIAMDANFAHLWEQYAAQAGPYPLSESESKALAVFLIEHPNVACVLVLDDEDNMSKPGKGDDKVKPESTVPMKADASLIALLGKRLKPEEEEKDEKSEASGDDLPAEPIVMDLEEGDEASQDSENDMEPVEEAEEVKPKWTAPRTADHGKGNFADWAYFQRGVLVLESSVWSHPMDSKGADGKALPKDASDQEKMLAWADSTYGPGHFQDWTPFVHKDLGPVEIGGSLPFVGTTPPASTLPELIEQYASFVDALAEDFANIEWVEVTYTSLDDKGVYEIRAKLVNNGRFASTTAMGQKSRVALPIRVELELPEGAQLLVGRARSSVARLAGYGGHRDYHWIVRVPAGSGSPKLIARSNTAGQARLTLEVK